MRSNRYLALILPALLLLPLAASANVEYQRLLEGELSKLDYFNPEHWAFTQTEVRDDNIVIAKYDPSRPEKQRWQLVSRNSKAASYDQMLDFRSDKRSEAKSNRKRLQEAIEEGEPVEDGLVSLIDWNSLELIDNSDKRVILRFQPRLDRFDEDEETLLVGVATFDKASKQLLSIAVVNRDVEGSEYELPVESFTMKIDFLYQNDTILLKNKSTLVRELSSLFGGGEEREEVKYSDYQAVK